MNLPSLRFFAFSFACLLTTPSFLAAEEKTYSVSGPVIAVDANSITLTQGKGTEKYVISRNASTQTSGNLKTGDQVRVDYMTATTIGEPVGAPVPVAPVTPRVVPGPPRSLVQPPATAPRHTMPVGPSTSGDDAVATPTPTPAKPSSSPHPIGCTSPRSRGIAVTGLRRWLVICAEAI
jgi:hypothetical protein